MNEDYDGIDFNKLKDSLVEIENLPKKTHLCPCRGLVGELARKQVAEMAGCMHSGMTSEDREEIKIIQTEYDKKNQFGDKTTGGKKN